ncbi:MAG: glycosyltransferase family 4 protein [Acidobacteriota bacterium]
MRIPLVYALHSGNLYGTERMALSTASGLAAEFSPVIVAPPGPALEEARRSGFEAIPFQNAWQFATALRPVFARSKRLAFLATGVMHSSVCLAWNALYRRRVAHLHLVHGGAAENLSYGRKAKLNNRPVGFVAVSGYVRERLIANGVNAAQVTVIENFLPQQRVAACPRRRPFSGSGVRRLIVISRLDPEKRVDLLLDALERDPEAGRFEVRVFGTGWNAGALRQRVAASNLNVTFAGFQGNVDEALAESDLLVHLCPVEPFGLAIIEAMAAGVPVLAPDAGGAGSLVEDGVSGFHFRANEAESLKQKLRYISNLDPDKMNAVVREGDRLLATRFSEAARVDDYRRILMERLA